MIKVQSSQNKSLTSTLPHYLTKFKMVLEILQVFHFQLDIQLKQQSHSSLPTVLEILLPYQLNQGNYAFI